LKISFDYQFIVNPGYKAERPLFDDLATALT